MALVIASTLPRIRNFPWLSRVSEPITILMEIRRRRRIKCSVGNGPAARPEVRNPGGCSMFYLRFIVALMTLTLGIFLFDSPSLAQNPALRPPEDPWSHFGSDPFDQLEPAGDPPHTAMERDAEQMGSNSDVLFASRAPQPGVRPAGGDTVSVQQLRHPLSRKARGLLAKAESFFKHGQRDKGKQQLAEAIKEPSAAPYAHAMLGTEYLRDGQAHRAIL